MPTLFYQQVAPFHFSKNYFRFIFCFFWSYWRDSNPRRRSHCFLVFRFVFSSQISPYERVLSFPAHIHYVQGPHSINRSLPFIFQKTISALYSVFFGATGGIRTRDLLITNKISSRKWLSLTNITPSNSITFISFMLNLIILIILLSQVNFCNFCKIHYTFYYTFLRKIYAFYYVF